MSEPREGNALAGVLYGLIPSLLLWLVILLVVRWVWPDSWALLRSMIGL